MPFPLFTWLQTRLICEDVRARPCPSHALPVAMYPSHFSRACSPFSLYCLAL